MRGAPLAAWQRAMRGAYRGASYGQFASALVWAASASTVTWGARSLGMLVLVLGGCCIYPATLLLMRLDGRRAPSAAENPLQMLGAPVAFVLPASMPVLVPLLERDGAPAFFPVMLILVGAHSLPFTLLYGMRSFRWLAAALVAGGCLLVRVPAAPPALAAWYGAAILLLWAALGRWLADREAPTR